MYYLTYNNKYLGKHGMYTDEQLEEADKIQTQWELGLKRYSFQELLEIFPEAKPAFRRYLVQEIKQCKQDLDDADSAYQHFNNNVLRYVSPANRWFFEQLRDRVYVEPLTTGREQRIKRARFYLSTLKAPIISSKKLTEQDIQQAKEVPVESLYIGQLHHQGNIATGQCPFHQERTPSFTIYLKTNKWYCFGCSTGTDSIDYIMHRDNCDFITAVKKLLNK